MFVAKDQEYTDAHTGIALAFGEHYQTVEPIADTNIGVAPPDVGEAPPAGRLSWLRVTVPGREGEPARTATLQFRNGQIVRSDRHEAAVIDGGPAGETSDADGARISGAPPPYDPEQDAEDVASKKKRK